MRDVAQRSGMLERFGSCFGDYRDSRLIEHQVDELVAQRMLASAQGMKISTIMTRCATIHCWRWQ
ncbi:MAG: hypothetical protein JO189_28675 [Deltaproteobacteria bacterium]|nr:hypothetical protein [Deltaproteobacteria bacterium]